MGVDMNKKGRKVLLPLLLLAVFTVFTAAVGDVWGRSYTCRKVVDDCESSNNLEYGSCIGFIAGMSGWEYFLQANLDQHKLICFPEEITTGKLKRAFMQYVYDHPDEMDKDASLCFYYAMSEAFSCKR